MDNNESIIADEQITVKENKWALKDRLKSKALWASIVGLIVTIVSALGLWDKIGITSDAFEGIMTAIGTVLSTFGILNNPTDSEHF